VAQALVEVFDHLGIAFHDALLKIVPMPGPPARIAAGRCGSILNGCIWFGQRRTGTPCGL